MKHTWTVPETTSKKRLDVFLVDQLEAISRSQIKKLIENACVSVNGKVAAVHHFLKPGDIVEVNDEKREQAESEEPRKKSGTEGISSHARRIVSDGQRTANNDLQAANYELRVVAETTDWIVVYKPCGILMHPDHDHEEGTLIDLVIRHAPKMAKVGEDPERPGIVSRLDKDVSGLVVIAKTQAAFDHLKNQFAQHTVKKIYTALVHGEMEQEEGDIKFRIARSTSKARMSALPEGSEAGQAAWTHYETLQRFRDISLLKLEIMTGRTHQIRAHLYASNHPIIGDVLYKPKSAKRNIETPRLMLQSTFLGFNDPATGERKEFELPLDEDFQKILDGLK